MCRKGARVGLSGGFSQCMHVHTMCVSGCNSFLQEGGLK